VSSATPISCSSAEMIRETDGWDSACAGCDEFRSVELGDRERGALKMTQFGQQLPSANVSYREGWARN